MVKCELSALWQDIPHKHGGRQPPEDMDEKTLGRAHLAGDLDAGFLLNPIEDRLDGLAHPRDGAGQPSVGGVEMRLALLLLDRRHHGERQPVRALEVFIRFIGVEFLVGQRVGDLLQRRAIVEPRRREADEARARQRAGLKVADHVDLHAVIVQFLGRAVTTAGQLGRDFGVETAPLPGEDHRHGVDQPGERRRLARRAEPLQQGRKAVRKPV